VELLSADHVGALLAITAAAAAVVGVARVRPGDWLVPASRAIALALLAAYVTDQVVAASRGIWSIRLYLPLHLSDAATLAAVLALWTHRPALVELTYFWGLTGALQATLTPDLGDDFPDILYVTYFVTHGGVVLAALLLVAGRGIVPRPGAAVRAFAATVALAIAAAAGCLATGGNYMFLRRKPPDSLLDLLGPWPVYIAGAALLAAAMFALLAAPFRGRARL
jgi:hypothetical integral membrane protein (TIGR02206 family)